ncbi:MAG: ROK family protein [Nitrospirae bacterium]|nr:ROK family protein [Nitrospirota bacterium]
MPKRAPRRAPEVSIGVDLGGTGIRFARVTVDGDVIGRPGVVPVVDRRKAAVLGQLRRAVVEACSGSQAVEAVGIGVPGFIRRDRGVIVRSPNFPDWRNVPVRQILQRDVAVPLVIENDANAAALGEDWIGAGQGGRGILVMLTLGTGVGGGLVSDGRLITGRDGMAGEIGHQTVDPSGPPCTCGNTGCLETYASYTGLVANYRRRTGSSEDELSGLELAARARRGDAEAQLVFADMGWALGVTLANLINLLNPSRIVLGGGLSGAWPLFIRRAMQEIDRRAIRAAARGVLIRRAKLGTAAGMIGAARAAWQAVTGTGHTGAVSRLGRRVRPTMRAAS